MSLQNTIKRRHYLLLFVFGLAVSLVAARFQPVAGYMDAEYYYACAIRIYEGYGWTQPFLWNYLDDPLGLPHHSFTYWMPLAALIGAAGMFLAGSTDFFAARLVFILLAALLPPLTAWLSFQLTQSKQNATLAGLLAVFPGYYLVYTTLTENFTLYMILGSMFLAVAAIFPLNKLNWQRALLLGVLAGFMHLTRADGLIWLLAAQGIGVAWVWKFRQPQQNFILTTGKFAGVILIGYILVMSPWFWRNIEAFGSLFPPGGSRSLWLTDYNQTVRYPASEIDIAHWLSAGLIHNLNDRLHAFLMNLRTTLAVQASVFLLPLSLTGLWRLRRHNGVQLAVCMWLVTFGVMTFVFPYAGWRGGFIHSGAALQPLWWAIAPLGLDAFIRWGVRHRNWDEQSAKKFFSASLVVLSCFLAMVVFLQKVVGSDPQNPAWQAGFNRYVAIEQALPRFGVQPDDIVIVNNPPGLFLVSRRASIVVPDGTEETVLAVAHRFHANYLLIDENHTEGLGALYDKPGNRPGMEYLGSVEGTRIYRLDE
jgi:hypothetical protein